MTKASERRRRYLLLRIGFLTSLLVMGAGAVMFKVWNVQVRSPDQYRAAAENQYQRSIKLYPRRGAILDRDGAPLAVSADSDSIWVSPSAMRKAKQAPAPVAQKLSELLGVDKKWLLDRLVNPNGRHFVWVKRRVTAAQGKAVRSLGFPGVYIEKEARRFYPNSELASHLLGFASIDGVGAEGLERMLDDELRGPVRPTPAIFDARGGMVFSQQLLDQRAAQGNDVTLSLDKTIQHIAERELELAVGTSEAHAASLVALDPSTGELLAIANYPRFNPNEPAKSPPSSRRNRAVTDRFEPGSTVKPFTLAGALASGAISRTEVIDCENGVLRVGTDVIRDSHRMQLLTPAEVLAKSSNIGTAKIAMELGRPGLHRTMTRFGFGEPTGIGLPGEANGLLRPYKSWYDLDAASISFGQGMSATTVQLAMAMGALANQGRLMEPILVKSIADPQGQVVQRAVPRERRQVVPENVARLMTDMLVGVTGAGGTGTEAAIEGYLVAGKTGTAQKADPVRGGYSKDKWTASFVGYAPAHKPRLVIAVIIDEPMIAHQGGRVAGPVFRRVMQASLQHLGVPADTSGSLRAQVLARHQALANQAQPLTAANPLIVNHEQGLPAPALPKGRNELLVPNFVGQTARDAVARARQAQFAVRVVGSGVVVRQEPMAQTRATRGSQLTLQLRPPGPSDVVTRSGETGSRNEELSHAKAMLRPIAAARGGRDG